MDDLKVGLKKKNELLKKILPLGIKDEDIIERFIKSSGPGGQNVNKATTCVYLKHIPTGIEVKCQKERSQALNRYIARKILASKIAALHLKKITEERKRIEKARRQKRKRSRKAQLKILEEKRRHAQKKLLRVKVREIE